MRSLALILAFFISTTAIAFQPRIGLWGNTAESGSGYMIDIQNGLVALTAYSYQSSGPSQWYLASGPLTNSGHNFVATLDKYTGGQCISCTYRPASLAGNDGTITITFVSETMATLGLPGGRTTVIQPFDFGYGPLPGGLLGEWIFVYDIGSVTFADRFDFTQTMSGTSTGTGLAVDLTRVAVCELQVSGVAAGMVICGDGDAAGNLQNVYAFHYGLDETFDGVWISPTTYDGHPMKGFRVGSKDDAITRASVPPDGRAHALRREMASADAARPASVEAQQFIDLANAVGAALANKQ